MSRSNSACRTRSAVGRVLSPGGVTRGRPRQAPATILTDRYRTGGAGRASAGSCSRSTLPGTSSTAPRSSEPSWNGP